MHFKDHQTYSQAFDIWDVNIICKSFEFYFLLFFLLFLQNVIFFNLWAKQ